MSPYEMCIANIARKIQKTDYNNPKNLNMPNAFDYAIGIAEGFCKDPEEVVLDIVNFKESTTEA